MWEGENPYLLRRDGIPDFFGIYPFVSLKSTIPTKNGIIL
jgi:hypothetical protein